MFSNTSCLADEARAGNGFSPSSGSVSFVIESRRASSEVHQQSGGRARVMFRATKRRIVTFTTPLLEDGERIEVMVHLLAGSVGWVLNNVGSMTDLTEPLGTVEFGVLTDRRLMIFASDLEGRPVATLLFQAPRAGMVVAGAGGRYIRWVALNVPGWQPFRLFFPPVARREGSALVGALSCSR